ALVLARCLDEQDVPSHARLREPRRYPRDRGPLRHLLEREPLAPQVAAHILAIDDDRSRRIAAGELGRDLAEGLAELPLEVPHARFPRVGRDDLAERFVRDGHLMLAEPVALDLPRHEVMPGDRDLL